MQQNVPGQPVGPSLEDRFSNMDMFLKFIHPDGYNDYFNLRGLLLGKELSIGVTEREDMQANAYMVNAIQECIHEGQIDFALDRIVRYLNDWKATMSIDGELLRHLTTSEVKYDQTQHVYEHPVEQSKKKMFGKR